MSSHMSSVLHSAGNIPMRQYPYDPLQDLRAVNLFCKLPSPSPDVALTLMPGENSTCPSVAEGFSTSNCSFQKRPSLPHSPILWCCSPVTPPLGTTAPAGQRDISPGLRKTLQAFSTA